MRAAHAGIAVAIAAAGLAGCGGGGRATHLTIEMTAGDGIRAFRLDCDPAGGTAPDPRKICAEVGRSPELLVGGPVLDHSCPARDYEAFRVSGTYRGYAIDADFPPESCALVPGQDGAGGMWSYLMEDAGPGRLQHTFGKPRLTAAQRKRRRARLERAERLQRHARRLVRDWNAGRRSEALARRVFREQLQAEELAGRPLIARASVYRTTRRRAERALGFREPLPNGPVYLVAVRYAYRDYTGRRHVAEEGTWSLYDARTLASGAGGLASAPSFRGLGRPVRLPL